MTEIKFQKMAGQPSLGVAFYWALQIHSQFPASIDDYFIPELYFDYFYIHRGAIQCRDDQNDAVLSLPGQTLKSLFTRPLRLILNTPLVLYGARLSLRFAEYYWGREISANNFFEADWVGEQPAGLADFRDSFSQHVREQRTARHPFRMLSASLEETEPLMDYSARHKRRLYHSTFGLSRKEMLRIRSVHTFLEEKCDFGARSPRIIAQLDPQVFYDQPHLNRAFKKMTGLSPLEYFQVGAVLQDNLMAASYNA